MIVYDTEYGGLYDKDEKTREITKVLRCFHDNNRVTFDRFPYADNGEYSRAIPELLYQLQCTYYLEDGSRPLKTKDCSNCSIRNACNHNQKLYNQI